MSTPRVLPFQARAGTRDPARDFAKSLEGGIVDGQLIDSEVPGTVLWRVPHSLGRAYRGAIIVAQGLPGTAVHIAVVPPDESGDAGNNVLLLFDTLYTGRVVLWVF